MPRTFDASWISGIHFRITGILAIRKIYRDES